jgi:hypothetical protein
MLIVHFTQTQLAMLAVATSFVATTPALQAEHDVTPDDAAALAALFEQAQPGFVSIPPQFADLLVAELEKIKPQQEDPERVRLVVNAAAKINAARGQ